jgi:spore coat protein A, manganese oxidase
MDITRRTLFMGAGALGAGALLRLNLAEAPARAEWGRALTPYQDALTWPTYVDASRPVRLRMVDTSHRFASSMPATPTLAYQLERGHVLGQQRMPGYLGPTLVVPTGRPTNLTVRNGITSHPLGAAVDTALHGVVEQDRAFPRTVVHLHGGNTRPDQDGGPLETWPPTSGQKGRPDQRPYVYGNTQDAAALWYHDHALGITRLNVHAGLAGGYLVRDTARTGIDTGDGGHLPAGEFEIPLIVQDKSFDADGRLVFPPAPWSPESFGDVPVVNGTAFPRLDVVQGVYRFRLYDAANARAFRLTFRRSDGTPLVFWQIGSDGGLFHRPVWMTELLVTPGERADLLVDFRGQDGVITLTNDAAAPYPFGDDVELPEIMQFVVGPGTGWEPPGPIGDMVLRAPITRLSDYAGSAVLRTHSLVEIVEDDEVVMGLLNNRMMMDEDYARHPVRRNTLEIWELVNTTMDMHPIHLHLVQFQVLDRQAFDAERYLHDVYGEEHGGMTHLVPGAYPPPSPATGYLSGPVFPPDANERGWKDTVAAPPGTVTRIIVPFGARAVPGPIASTKVYAGDYVWHCHILDHEDNDMMQRFRVV